MHIQSHFEENRSDVLQKLIRAQALATFIFLRNNEIVVNHMPLYIDTESGDPGVLKGHIPRTNSIWKTFDGERTAVAVFQGPAAYITPSWYSSKQQHGKVVPTWNYVVAHARGCPRAVHDSDWLLAHLRQMTEQQESTQEFPWQVSDAPSEYIDKMMGHIVGIEMPIASLVGKWKVSQNRSEEDQLGVAAGLRNQGEQNSIAMANLVGPPHALS